MKFRLTKHSLCILTIAFASGLANPVPCTKANAQVLADRNAAARRLPQDNVALFDSVKRTVTVQLETLSGSLSDTLDQTFVSVVTPDQEVLELQPDEQGLVTIENARAGVYAIIAATPSAHAAIAIACRALVAKKEDKTDTPRQFALDFEKTPKALPVTLTLMDVSGDKLQPIIKNNFPDSIAPGMNIIDQATVTNGRTVSPFENTIQLGDEGALRGRLFSLVNPLSRHSGVQGTLAVVFKDGVPVGKTTANALGQFQINGLRPGKHGLVIAGRGGYAAIGFHAVDNDGLVARSDGDRGFAYTQLMNDGEIMPIVMLPPPMMPTTAKAIEQNYERLAELADAKSEMVLAQDFGPEKEDLDNLEVIRKSLDNDQQDREPAEAVALRQSLAQSEPAKRGTATRLLESSPPVSSPPVSSPPEPDASESVSVNAATKPTMASRRSAPINPLRLPLGADPNVPVNPLRAN